MEKLKEKIKKIPKGELHVHLNGLISKETIKKIIIDENIPIPTGFDLDTDLVRLNPASSLSEYLKPWDLLRLFPAKRNNLKLIVENAFNNLSKENIRFVEIRNTILYIARLNDISVDLAMSWLIEELEACEEKYNITSGLILTISRSNKSIEHFNEVIGAYQRIGKPKKIIGIDLAGNEDCFVDPKLAEYFKNAKDKFNLGITIHAGETGNKSNIKIAIKEFGADRIGHGTAAGYCIETMEYLKEHNVCIEVCPISNRLTGAVKETELHPVYNFFNSKVPFVICSDNPCLHNSSLSDDYFEYLKVCNEFDSIEDMFEKQKKYSFIGDLS